jgi:hypothetical protein
MPSTSAAASAAIPRPAISGGDVEMSNEVGDAKILNNLSEAFTIDGLFDHINPLKRHSAHNPLFTKEELAVLSPGVIDRAKLKSQAKKAKKRQMAQAKTEGELMYGMMGMDVEPQEPQISNEQKISNRQLRKEKKKARDARVRAEAQGVTKPKASTGDMELDGEVDIDQKKEADFAAFLANVGGESNCPSSLQVIVVLTRQLIRTKSYNAYRCISCRTLMTLMISMTHTKTETRTPVSRI